MAKIALILLGALLIAAAVAACGGPSTTEIVQTQTAQNRLDNATATAQAEATMAAQTPDTNGGGGPLTPLERSRATASARATEQAAQTPSSGNGGDVPGGSDVEIPDGPAQSGEVVVQIGNRGVFDPQVIKITPGTTVIWESDERTSHNTSSDPDQEESWDSGSMSRGAIQTEPARFEHTFTTPGCYSYRSRAGGDIGTGHVCVVEE
ncbi:MAG: plastocyanin/azurin family copper-binding protein [Dehalococcoidia bacterium]